MAKREVARRGLVGVPVGVRRAVARSWSSPTRSVAADFAAIDVIVQAEHGPDGLAWLITWDEDVADAVDARDRPPRRRRRPAGPTSRRTFAEGGYAVLVDGPEQAIAVGQRHRPRAPRAACAPTPRRSSPLVRHAGAVFCGAVVAGVGRRLHRRPEPRAADVRLGPLRPGADRRRLHQARPRRHRRRGRRCARSAPTSSRSPRPRARRARRLDPAAAGRPAVTRRVPRRATTCARWRATTRRRSTSTVRLNTNESPEPPPRGVARRARGRAVAGVDWHRYPDRAATELRDGDRRAARRRPGAGLRGQRLERGAADAAASPTAARAARSPMFEPTYALHGHIARLTGTGGGEGERARRLHPRPRRGRAGSLADADAGRSRSCARPTTRPGMVEPEATVRAGARPRRPACVVVDEAYGQFAPWSALELVDDDAPARRHPHLLQDVVDGGRPPRLPRRPGVAGRRAREGRAAVPPRRGQAGRRPAGAATSSARWRRGWPQLVEERGRLVAAAAPSCRVDVWPSGANFVLFRPDRSRRRARCGRRCSTASVLVRDCSSWPRLDGCLRVTVGTPAEDDAFLAALGRGPAPMSRRRRAAARTHQGDDDRRSRSTSTATGATDGQHRPARSSTTCSTSSAATAAST